MSQDQTNRPAATGAGGAASATEAKVEVRGLTKRFGEVVALDGVDLTLAPDEFVSLVGVSGCGKSTMLSIVAGLTEPTEGSVLVDGSPILGPGRDRGVVFQQATLLPWLTARKNVEFALRAEPLNHSERADLAREHLDLVGLTGFEDSYPAQLSGGMRQRVALARSLSYRPSILLMDEPFGALDALTRREMQELLIGIWESHRMTLLFVTHDIEEAVFLSDRVVTMTPRPGRLRAQLEVDLPRPRLPDLVAEPHFMELTRHLMKSFRGAPAGGAKTTALTTGARRGGTDLSGMVGLTGAADAGVDGAELRQLLADLVRTDSQNPPGNEGKLARLVGEYLAAAGLEVELREAEPGRPNVIARLTGTNPEALLFNAHLDTVGIGDLGLWSTEPLGAEVVDGNLYGRGACDMKGGLAAMMAAAAAVARSGRKPERSLLFTAVIDEEVWFKGTKSLIASGLLANCVRAYVGEPTSLGIASALQGAAEFTARVRGRSSHTGMAELGVNAIWAMTHVLEALRGYADGLAGRGAALGFGADPSLNLGTIKGGTGVTLVPDSCQIAFDRQVLPGEDIEAVISELRQLFAQTCQTHSIDGDLVCEQFFRPWQAEPDSPTIQALEQAHRSAVGTDPQPTLFRGYCEVELLAAAGIPGAVYGPGDLLQAHRPDEFVPLAEVEAAARTYTALATNFLFKTP
ncbi:MAG: ArgE/DapE family deacylase [Bifidobacteriaceae bacterium]|jgi:acetylornithine deacetylase/succinyl-diaminopimelate desuccinylase family protein|nr:ArgE/DapE family deacylase [Bifidobacteriaceae bacterium]